MAEALNCYKVTVKTTNSANNAFTIYNSDKYYECENSWVHVAAKSMEDAAKQIPDALHIQYVGKFFNP